MAAYSVSWAARRALSGSTTRKCLSGLARGHRLSPVIWGKRQVVSVMLDVESDSRSEDGSRIRTSADCSSLTTRAD